MPDARSGRSGRAARPRPDTLVAARRPAYHHRDARSTDDDDPAGGAGRLLPPGRRRRTGAGAHRGGVVGARVHGLPQRRVRLARAQPRDAGDELARGRGPHAGGGRDAAAGCGAQRGGAAGAGCVSHGPSGAGRRAGRLGTLHAVAADVRSRRSAALERVGRERGQHALSAGRPGAAEPRGRTAAGAQVGLRFSRGNACLVAAGGRGRPAVRRQPERPRLCARRPRRVHALDLHRPFGRAHRDQRGAVRGRVRGVLRRRGRDGVRGRRRERRARVDPARRRSPGGADHGRADLLRRPALRAGVVAGRGVRDGPGLRMLPVPRQRRRPRRGYRARDLADVHARRVRADRPHAGRRPRLGDRPGRRSGARRRWTPPAA